MRTRKLLLAGICLGAMSFSSCSTYSLVNSQVYNNADLAQYHTFRIISPTEESLPPGMQLVTYYNIAAAIREQMVERGYREDANSPIVVNIGLTINKELQTTPLGALMPPTPPPMLGPAPVPPPAPAPAPAPAPGPRPTGPMPSDGMQALPPGPTPPPPVPAPASHFFFYPGPGPAPMYAPYFMMPRSYYWNTINPATPVVTGIYREGVLTMDIVDMNTKEALYSASVAAIIDNGDTQFRNLKGIAEAVQVLFSKYPVPLLPQYAKN